MGWEFSSKTGIYILPLKKDVKIVLDKEEVEFGRNVIHKISKNNHNLPVVVIAPETGVKNKNLSKIQLENLVKGVSGFAVPCLLEPLSDSKKIEGATYVGDKDLRKATAILYASNAYLGSDSRPFHMINAALQGTPQEFKGNINTDLGKVLLLVGSSHPNSIKYEGNKFIWSNGGCGVSPCGAHGYSLNPVYSGFFDKKFYEANLGEDKSGCIFENYEEIETARCMASIHTEEIIETVRKILK